MKALAAAKPIPPDDAACEEAAKSAVLTIFRTEEAIRAVLPDETDIDPAQDFRVWSNGGCLVAAEAVLKFLSEACPGGNPKIHCVRHGKRRIHFVTVMDGKAYDPCGVEPVAKIAKKWGGPRTAATARPTTPGRANLSVYRNEEMSEKIAEMIYREYELGLRLSRDPRR